jgi:hypothetical protein
MYYIFGPGGPWSLALRFNFGDLSCAAAFHTLRNAGHATQHVNQLYYPFFPPGASSSEITI